MGGKKTEAKGKLGMKTQLNGGERKTPEIGKENWYEGKTRKRKANEHDSNPKKVERKKTIKWRFQGKGRETGTRGRPMRNKDSESRK